MSTRLLLVEDDPRLLSVLQRGLEAEGYVVDAVPNGQQALERVRSHDYALIVLDRMMPGADGVEICRTLRAEGCRSSVLMLTAKDALQDKIDGLKSGADDYLTKPFAFAEVLARIEALLRRPAPSEPRAVTLQVADLRLDAAAKVAWRGERRIALTPREFALLHHLMRQPGTVVGRSELLAKVWNLSHDPGTKVLEVQISLLRRKIDGGDGVALIENVRGFGYTISDGQMK
jgi:DNA-binding response OmpR family regulator